MGKRRSGAAELVCNLLNDWYVAIERSIVLKLCAAPPVN